MVNGANNLYQEEEEDSYEDSYEEEGDSSALEAPMELIAEAFNKKTRNNFKFFLGKGFRKYDRNLGAWVLVSDREEALRIVCDAIRQTPNLRDDKGINKVQTWSAFLNWYKVAEQITPPAESDCFLSFRNGTLDLRTMVLEKHRRNNYCFQAVDSIFKFGPPREATMKFFFL